MEMVESVDDLNSVDDLKSSRSIQGKTHFAEIHVLGGNIILVATRDVLSFASVCPESFPS